jgi:CIC family chloride channel protein
MAFPSHSDQSGAATAAGSAPATAGAGRRRGGQLAVLIGDQRLLLATAVLVGLGAGLGAVAFRWLIDQVRHLSFDVLPRLVGDGGIHLVLAPVLGGLIVGPMIYFFAREAKGHGVPEVMAAVALRGGRIRPIVAVVKSLASSLSIGSGGSVGREGPIVQIGSTLGSTLGQWLRLSDDRIRNLVACGAAGGIAATFNAPIAGVFFALEVILGDFSVGAFGSVVVSSVTASVVGRAAFGDEPAFHIPEYSIHSLWELPMYLGLGLAAALVAVAYTRSVYAAEDLFDGWRQVPEWVKPAIGGLLLGCLALAYGRIPGLAWDSVPQVYGVGYDTIEAGLLGSATLAAMLAFMALKVAATSITLGSGGSGGVFAPGLFIGSMLGGSFGLLMQQLFPGVPGPAGAYALVGMGAIFAGSTHAAMTGVIMMFEMTGDYKIILPLMLAVAASTVLSGKLMRHETIYTLKLSRRGVRLRRGRDVDVLEGVRAKEVMSETMTVPPDTPARGLSELFVRANRNALPVVEDDRLVGIVSLTDVRKALDRKKDDDGEEEPTELYVRDLMTTSLVVAHPDDTLGEVLQRMGPRDLSRLPVVAPDDPQKLLGVVRRNDVVRAYNLALTRRERAELQLPEHLRARGKVSFVEVELMPGAACVGQTVAAIGRRLPAESLLVSIRRAGGEAVFPHGDTRFEAGDRVLASVRTERQDELRRLLEER